MVQKETCQVDDTIITGFQYTACLEQIEKLKAENAELKRRNANLEESLSEPVVADMMRELIETTSQVSWLQGLDVTQRAIRLLRKLGVPNVAPGYEGDE